MAEFLDEQPEELEEYDEQLVRRLVQKITVLDDYLSIEFKSCVEIEIELSMLRSNTIKSNQTTNEMAFTYGAYY